MTVHSISSLGVRLRFSAGLSWRDAAAEEGFDRLDECRAAEGAPDAFRAAQPVMHGVVPLTPRQQGGDVGEPWTERAGRRGAVVTAREMRMQALPGPVTGTLDQSGPHGIEQDIAHRRG